MEKDGKLSPNHLCYPFLSVALATSTRNHDVHLCVKWIENTNIGKSIQHYDLFLEKKKRHLLEQGLLLRYIVCSH